MKPAEESPKVKVLLVTLKNYQRDEGIASLASSLIDNDYLKKLYEKSKFDARYGLGEDLPEFEVSILYANMEGKGFSFENYLEENRPDIVGIGFDSTDVSQAYGMADTVRDVLPNALRCAGGVHPSALPEEVVANSSFEIVCVGEGEETLPEIAFAFAKSRKEKGVKYFREIKGIFYRDKEDKILGTDSRKFVFSLDDYPFASASWGLMEKYKFLMGLNSKAVYLSFSRGCPYNCVYCAKKAVFGNRTRIRSVGRTLQEMKMLMDERGVNEVFFVDDIFTLDKRRVEELCNALLAKEIEIDWSMQTRADKLDRELVKLMKKAGLKAIAIGIESGDEELREQVFKKYIEQEEVLNVMRMLKEEGIDVLCNIIVGAPGQGWESILRTVDFLMEVMPDSVVNFICVPYPGSDLYGRDEIRLVLQPGEADYPHYDKRRMDPSELPITSTDVMDHAEILRAFKLLASVGTLCRQNSRIESDTMSKAEDLDKHKRLREEIEKEVRSIRAELSKEDGSGGHVRQVSPEDKERVARNREMERQERYTWDLVMMLRSGVMPHLLTPERLMLIWENDRSTLIEYAKSLGIDPYELVTLINKYTDNFSRVEPKVDGRSETDAREANHLKNRGLGDNYLEEAGDKLVKELAMESFINKEKKRTVGVTVRIGVEENEDIIIDKMFKEVIATLGGNIECKLYRDRGIVVDTDYVKYVIFLDNGTASKYNRDRLEAFTENLLDSGDGKDRTFAWVFSPEERLGRGDEKEKYKESFEKLQGAAYLGGLRGEYLPASWQMAAGPIFANYIYSKTLGMDKERIQGLTEKLVRCMELMDLNGLGREFWEDVFNGTNPARQYSLDQIFNGSFIRLFLNFMEPLGDTLDKYRTADKRVLRSA
jgi:radical SAM superfamily enzyme YgiQ (UPF0313 family)